MMSQTKVERYLEEQRSAINHLILVMVEESFTEELQKRGLIQL